MIGYYCVIDYECTCLENCKSWKHEIIEFPCIVVCAKTKKVIAQFHQYVKPTESPILTSYCTQLTGITQNRVKNAKTLDVVLQNFEYFLQKHGLFNEDGTPNFAICTDGPWDIECFLYRVC